jgi:hypothetical protein
MLGGRVQWRDVRELSLAVAVGLSFFCLGNAALHDAGTDDTPPLNHVGRARREMKKHEPKLVENTKTLLALKGLACSSIVTDMLKDLVRATHDCSPFAPASPLPSITSFCTGAQALVSASIFRCTL